MVIKIVFDTLEYAKMLEKGGVEYADIHSASLAEALSQNIYTKNEVDMKFEELLRESANERRAFEKRTEEIKIEAENRTEKLSYEMRLDFKEFENRLDQIYARTIITTVGILGTLIVVVGAVATLSNYFFR